MINKNEDGREIYNVVYTDNNGTKVTSEKQYTKFPYDVETVTFLEEGHEMLTISNPFSGAEYELTPVEESVYSMIMGSQLMPGYSQNDKLIKIVRDGLTWFRANNAKAYMALLD